MRRVVLKLSGEALASAASDETIDASTVDFLAIEISTAMERGDLELAVVVGGGNIWRGATGAMAGMNRANSDLMGMLGTVINALALQDAIENHGRPTRAMSAVNMDQVAEPYIRRRAVRHLERVASSSSARVPATRTSLPTPRPHCARPPCEVFQRVKLKPIAPKPRMKPHQ